MDTFAGPITDTTIDLKDFDFRTLHQLMVVIEGTTTGAKYINVYWTWNGKQISNGQQVHGVNIGSFFIGELEELKGGDPCETRMYRVSLTISGRLPGVYQYTVINSQSPNGVQSKEITISGN